MTVAEAPCTVTLRHALWPLARLGYTRGEAAALDPRLGSLSSAFSQGDDADGLSGSLNGNGSAESKALADGGSGGNWLDDHRWKALRRLGSMAGWLIDPLEVRLAFGLFMLTLNSDPKL